MPELISPLPSPFSVPGPPPASASSPTSATAPPGSGAREPGAWIALHVFYAASPRPMLVDCVRPLVARLTEEGLITGHFFINYWLEGPHVRLRLRPASPAAAPEVRRRAGEALTAFLANRPALYEVDSGFLKDFYNALFDIEFPGEDRGRFMGDDGRMRLRPNNTFSEEPYAPEYAKYGGPAGVELAEWHFRHSSDLVTDAFRTMNLHLRTVLLGTSAQLMMVMASCFLSEEDRLADYLDGYYEFWHRAFPGTGFIGSKEYERNYAEMAPALGRRFTAVRSAVATGELGRLPSFLRGWAEHCLELRCRIEELAARGDLLFPVREGPAREDTGQARSEPVDAPPVEALTHVPAVLPRLLSPYMHMTNNRLHVTIRDEAYLSFVLGQVLRERPHTGASDSTADGVADGLPATDADDSTAKEQDGRAVQVPDGRATKAADA
ncbi:lantibiotic dehydratase C-terminal domain-containing protein [Streptomyces zaomyceticus]|uniref:lantibiotic dehydratase C-terminal domain-containing protein n=1 Tax=Streptomyces zaomyceticus TaxID=68286 RepID=UPI0016784561|nr:lantibiotic dehydratase C-terminal domain-containing protein [Streptomyces zaomyceticus]GHF99229.1 lantibiotic biosynthesis protein [Streptomyces zaomyceticus]